MWVDGLIQAGLTRSRRGMYPKDAYGWMVYEKREKKRETVKKERESDGGRGGGGESAAVCSRSVSELRNAPERAH